ncbi:MAG: hypothetical protein PUB07_00215 [Clostridia bacterium]|nr:hypothetical protein [Clostridia bacterium]
MFKIGKPVTGKDFIGRAEEILKLKNAILEKRNISVCGLSRIGKSSVVKETIRQLSMTDTEKIVFIHKALTGNREEGLSLFGEILERLEEEAEDAGILEDEGFQKHLKRAQRKHEAGRTDYLPYKNLCNTFCSLMDCDIWLVIDEMDYAQTGLRDTIQNLRELINESDRVYVLNISRHSLETIFPKDAYGSSYPGIIPERIYITAYSDSDVALFKARMDSVSVSDATWERLLQYTGNVPFFLALFANRLIACGGEIPDFTAEDCFMVYTKTLRYWEQAICSIGLMEATLAFLNGETNLQDMSSLRAYGLVTDQQTFIIPYFGELLATSKHDDVLAPLIEEYTELLPTIEELESICKKEVLKVFDASSSLAHKLAEMTRELRAMHIKITCMADLAQLKTFVQLDATVEEQNYFKQKISEFKREINNLY